MEAGAIELDQLERPGLFAKLDSAALAMDRVRRLKSAFEKLTPTQRQVIELAYYEGMSQTENGRASRSSRWATVKNLDPAPRSKFCATSWRRRPSHDSPAALMTCQELQESFELYALGALEPEEKAEIEAHLARGCDNCTQALSAALALNARRFHFSRPLVKPRGRLKAVAC